MEIKMPVMDGKIAAREIRKLNKYEVIIAQKAKALMGDEQTMLKPRFNDYITKPIIKEALHALIN
jgi:CheY-like chemotaxis protein